MTSSTLSTMELYSITSRTPGIPMKLWRWDADGSHSNYVVSIKNHLNPRRTVWTADWSIHGSKKKLVALKIAKGRGEVTLLEQEARIYLEHLGPLRGKVVPKYYGLFKGMKDGVDFACMLLEYCSGTVDHVNFNGQVMLAACKLHAEGVFHGDLANVRHIVPSDNGIRIVDFSSARAPHQCNNDNHYPCKPGFLHNLNNRGTSVSRVCRELMALENVYGMREIRQAVPLSYDEEERMRGLVKAQSHPRSKSSRGHGTNPPR